MRKRYCTISSHTHKIKKEPPLSDGSFSFQESKEITLAQRYSSSHRSDLIHRAILLHLPHPSVPFAIIA